MVFNRRNEVHIKVTADDADAQRAFDNTKRGAEDVNTSLRTMAFAAAGVATAFGGFAAITVKAAVNLEESVNAVNVVFKEAADTIHAFGQEAAQTVGLARGEFNQLATVTGAMLKNVGFSLDEAAEQAINLTQRAADMASVFNTDVQDALGAINAALRGEIDPIERFGVSMNAAKVEAKALELGLAETKAEITDTAKQQARLALIFEQTADVEGDFRNTSDNLANSLRILKADVTGLAAEIGAELVPAVQVAVSQMRGWVGDVRGAKGDFETFFDSVTDGMSEIDQLGKNSADSFAAWVNEISGGRIELERLVVLRTDLAEMATLLSEAAEARERVRQAFEAPPRPRTPEIERAFGEGSFLELGSPLNRRALEQQIIQRNARDMDDLTDAQIAASQAANDLAQMMPNVFGAMRRTREETQLYANLLSLNLVDAADDFVQGQLNVKGAMELVALESERIIGLMGDMGNEVERTAQRFTRSFEQIAGLVASDTFGEAFNRLNRSGRRGPGTAERAASRLGVLEFDEEGNVSGLAGIRLPGGGLARRPTSPELNVNLGVNIDGKQVGSAIGPSVEDSG